MKELPEGYRAPKSNEIIPGWQMPPGTFCRVAFTDEWEDAYEFNSTFAPTWKEGHDTENFAVPQDYQYPFIYVKP